VNPTAAHRETVRTRSGPSRVVSNGRQPCARLRRRPSRYAEVQGRNEAVSEAPQLLGPSGQDERPSALSVSAGQRAFRLVGVTGFEPATSSSRTLAEAQVRGLKPRNLNDLRRSTPLKMDGLAGRHCPKTVQTARWWSSPSGEAPPAMLAGCHAVMSAASSYGAGRWRLPSGHWRGWPRPDLRRDRHEFGVCDREWDAFLLDPSVTARAR
jgi:hypothetical protein